MKNIKIIIILCALAIMTQSLELSAQLQVTPTSASSESIKWYTFQEAYELSKKTPKKMFIDVYTEWCGWCKKMDASTFKDPKIVTLMNKYFLPVKLDAEMRDSIKFQDHVFVNQNPISGRGASHDLAVSLLQGQMSYPTAVMIDEKYSIISPLPGYQTAEGLEPILIFIGDNKYLDTKWEDYIKTFKPSTN